MNIFEARFQATAPYLEGHGVELGAGPNPQKVPEGVQVTHLDIRTAEQLAKYFNAEADYAVRPISEAGELFPNGADFLIAHHVVEHTPDPVGELRRWHGLVRDGGVFVISAPHFAHCPDRERLVPNLEHLVLDHVLGRDGDAFESREHVLSFLCSWIDDSPGLAGMTADQACRRIASESRRSGHDFHWHAYDPQLVEATITAAALLDDMAPEFLVPPTRHAGDSVDILAVYRLRPARELDAGLQPFAGAMTAIRAKLERAADRLRRPWAE